MRHINGAYTTYYNIKRKRAGHLFQGRYKSILVEADEYLQELSRYLHLNPVRAGMVAMPETYKWSSYPAFIGKAKPPSWLRRDFVLECYGENITRAQEYYRNFVEDLLAKEYSSPLNKTISSTVLGSADFVEQIMKVHFEKETYRPDVPAVRSLNRRFNIDEIISKTQELFPDSRVGRDVSLHLCHQYTGETLKKIGSRFGLSDSGVAKAGMRLKKQMELDSKLYDKVIEIVSHF
jgi:hypothetical protein